MKAVIFSFSARQAVVGSATSVTAEQTAIALAEPFLQLSWQFEKNLVILRALASIYMRGMGP